MLNGSLTDIDGWGNRDSNNGGLEGLEVGNIGLMEGGKGDTAGEDMGMLVGGTKKLGKEAGKGEGFIGSGLAETRGGHAINECHTSSNQQTSIAKHVFKQTLTSKTCNMYTVSLNWQYHSRND